MRLYELSEKWNRLSDLLLDSIDDETGIVDADIAGELQACEASLRDKFAACCRLIRNMEANEAALKEERDRLAAKAKSIGNRIDGLKRYVKETMESLGESKFVVDEIFTLAIQNSPPAVSIENFDQVPASYDKPTERQLMLSAIRDDLKRGVEVPGAVLVQATHLRIR